MPQSQKWVYWSLEPPPHCVYRSLPHLNNTFNWTMTYKYDSVVLDTYVIRLRSQSHKPTLFAPFAKCGQANPRGLSGPSATARRSASEKTTSMS
ncbi:unnamed protein product [Ixodes persulcatus]